MSEYTPLELRKAGFADGNYYNQCNECGVAFIGAKGARVCRDCAGKALNEYYRSLKNEDNR